MTVVVVTPNAADNALAAGFLAEEGIETRSCATLGELLTLLGREHNSAQAEASFHILRKAGIPSLNVDLMFGLPGQSLEQWKSTLARTITLGPDHISAYCSSGVRR